MTKTLVIGGGLAGCTTALELADNNKQVVIIEKSGNIGGKVRQYGCKATSKCNKCGLCLVGDLWSKVESNRNIKIITNSRINDIYGTKGDFKVSVSGDLANELITGIGAVVVSIGFDEFSSKSSGHLEIKDESKVISGCKLEELLMARTRDKIFDSEPTSIAFIQCFGSRDIQEKAAYCSRVCCGYSTRAARVLRQYYPDSRIVFFYMDLQQVEGSDYFKCLQDEGIEFIKCRPVKVGGSKGASVIYERPGTDNLIEQEFDLIILSEGIHPPGDAGKIAEISMLGFDNNGFLKYVKDGSTTGIFMAGCVSGPKKIEEVCAEALTVSRQICSDL